MLPVLFNPPPIQAFTHPAILSVLESRKTSAVSVFPGFAWPAHAWEPGVAFLSHIVVPRVDSHSGGFSHQC